MKYVCKYAPAEILAGFGMEAEFLNPAADSFEAADRIIHSNVCSYSRALIEKRLDEGSEPMILTSCCDSMERVSDVLTAQGQKIFMLNLPHNNEHCSKLMYQSELMGFIKELSGILNKPFSPEKFKAAFREEKEEITGPHISVMGARLSSELLEFIRKASSLPVKNNTCTAFRTFTKPPRTESLEELTEWYADTLLSQTPCMRMADITSRRALTEDPNLRGIIYNTVNFCDFYSYEYSRLKTALQIPVLKVETDYTNQGAGQMKTRLDAFFENITEQGRLRQVKNKNKNVKEEAKETAYYAGIDSGSTSTNAVVIDSQKNIIAFAVVPTGVKVAESAQKALDEALSKGGIGREQINMIVTTGYGRANINVGSKDVTEITCHAKGAYFLDPGVRTIIDIGGQDSKVIRLDEKGNISDFVMNDKCAAGTGRFIEMMAQSLQLTLKEISTCGLKWSEDVTISSMCSVFAQSEVVSLIADDKKLEDIVHGINRSVASKLVTLVKRGKMDSKYMMTGGVARNIGVVRAIEEKLGTEIIIPEEPDICGALGAALIAAGELGE